MLSSRVAAVACVVVVASLVWSHAEGACQQGQFDCTGAGTVCVSQQQVCDGQKNCAGGQDENPASCGCIKGKPVGPNPGPGRVVRAPGPNKGPVSTRPGASACVCIASNVSSVVCGCAVGFVSDGQNGCKPAPPGVNQPLSRPSTRPPPSVNATAPATPGPRTRPGAPASPNPRPSTKPRGTSVASKAAPANPARR
ncbi:hypothetical protein EMCRGX_G008264 [Ephydatia muelleri]|eukprot:Em0002g282a